MFNQELRTISFVPRWAIARTINRQTVDGHSYFVTLYTLQLCKWLCLDDHTTLACVSRAIWHDQPESCTGDIPGPAKRSVCDPVKLKAFEAKTHTEFFEGEGLFPRNALVDKVVKVADLYDACMFLAVEVQMGNAVNGKPLLESQRAKMEDAVRALVQGNEQRFADLAKVLNGHIYNTCTFTPGWPDDEKGN